MPFASTIVLGISAETIARYDGAPAPPVAGPANTEFWAALVNAKESAGVELAFATDVVKSGLRLPALNVVTVPPELEAVADTLLPTTLNVTVALFTKLGLEITDPLIFTADPNGPAANASTRTKFSATIGSIPFKDRSKFGVMGSELSA
jgi:hypothetical protein